MTRGSANPEERRLALYRGTTVLPYYLAAFIDSLFTVALFVVGEWQAGLLAMIITVALAEYPRYRAAWYETGVRDGSLHHGDDFEASPELVELVEALRCLHVLSRQAAGVTQIIEAYVTRVGRRD